MAENVDVLAEIGQNRLEQVYVNKPEVRFYFAADKEQSEANLAAYLGNEQLELQSMQPFAEGEGSVYYYLLLDVSASISKGEFKGITTALSEFCETVREQDHVVFLTFGEEVKTLFDLDGKALLAGEATELVSQLTNPDQRTLLFEAINQTSELCESVPASESMRRVAMVITDGEDIATGKATKDEALLTLQESGIPVYGFVAQSSNRQQINAFGEFSRATGGYLTILEKGAEQAGFDGVREDILNSYEAVFTADSNMVDYASVGAVLQFKDENEKQNMQVVVDRWIPDQEAPLVTEMISQASRQVKVVFSEAVTGADSAQNFLLSDEDISLTPAFSSVGSDGKSAILSFAEDIPAGNYRLVCSNITDCSMEKNFLKGEAYIEIEGATVEVVETPAPTEPIASNPLKDYGWIIVLIVLAVLTAAALIAWKKLKKRQAVVTVEGKAVLSDHVAVSHHVSIEKKKLEEKQVYFHVQGQKQEIPIVIQKSMIVGRAGTCELIFDDPALSRQHFALELKEGTVFIQNLSQSGFTEVNGIKLGTLPQILRNGDEIKAGQLKLRVRW